MFSNVRLVHFRKTFVRSVACAERPLFSDSPLTLRFRLADIEHPAVSARTDQEVDAYRNEHEVVITGTDAEKPVTTFEESPFPGSISAFLHASPAGFPRRRFLKNM